MTATTATHHGLKAIVVTAADSTETTTGITANSEDHAHGLTCEGVLRSDAD